MKTLEWAREADSAAEITAPPVAQASAARPHVCIISALGYGLYRPESGLPFGGAEVQSYLLARTLAARPGRRVTVLTTVVDRAGIEMAEEIRVVRRQARGRAASQAGPFEHLSAFRDMFRQFAAIDADLYLHTGSGVEAGAYALICRLQGKRFVHVIASSADLSRSTGLTEGPLRRLYPLGVRLAHAVVCRTEEQRTLLAERYGRAGELIRTGHPIPTPAMPTVGTASPAATVGSESARSILWIGRAHPLKQPELFLDLAARLPEERFVMALMRDERHPAVLEAVRRRVASLANVVLHEDVAWNKIDGQVSDAKLFVNTSTYEGFPNTFVQAALHGVPIVSWRVNPDAVLTKEGLGACAEGSFDRLVEEVVRLCRDHTVRGEMGRRAKRYAETHHDIERAADAYEALFARLIP